MYDINEEHYIKLCENYKATKHLMSEKDQEAMKLRLNEIRKKLAYNKCVAAWKRGDTINIGDFIIICLENSIEITDKQNNWLQADIIEVGRNSYSSISKIGKTKERRLLSLCFELTSKLE